MICVFAFLRIRLLCLFFVVPPFATTFVFATRVDVLSEPFDVITGALLERQGLRRLIGFMGAAAVAAASGGKQKHMLCTTLSDTDTQSHFE